MTKPQLELRAETTMFLVLLSAAWSPLVETRGGFGHEENQDAMLLTFNSKYDIFFSHAKLRDYQQCLCSSKTAACRLRYEHDEDSEDSSPVDLRFFVMKVIRITSSSLGESNTFVCEDPPSSLDNGRDDFLLTCDRRKTSQCDKSKTRVKWEISDPSCRHKCINLCWVKSNVSFDRSISHSVPKGGRCVSSKPTNPDDASSATKSNSGTSSNSESPSNTDGSDTQNTEGKGTNVLSFVGLGFVLLLTIVAVVGYIVYRRRSLRKTVTVRTRKPSYADIEPYASTIEEGDKAARGTENLSPFPECSAVVSNKENDENRIYTELGNVYSTIEDKELKPSKNMTNTAGDRDHSDPNQTHLEYEKNGKGEVNNFYAKLSNGKTSMGSKFLKNVCSAYNTQSTGGDIIDQPRTGTEGVYDCATYSRLISRTEISPDLQRNLQETYDMAAGEFVTSPSRQIDDLMVSAQGRSTHSQAPTSDIAPVVGISNLSSPCVIPNSFDPDQVKVHVARENGDLDKTNPMHESPPWGMTGGYQNTTQAQVHSNTELQAIYFELEEMEGNFADECAHFVGKEMSSSDINKSSVHFPDEISVPYEDHYESVDSRDKDIETDKNVFEDHVQMSYLSQSQDNIYQEIDAHERSDYAELPVN